MHATKDHAEIIQLLKTALLKYAPPYKVREGAVKGKESLDLIAEGDYEAYGRKRTEIFFASIIGQKGYVGFYFMPIYSDPEAMRRIFSERLLKRLKGKSCFYITELDDELMGDIQHALAEGFKVYKERGWV